VATVLYKPFWPVVLSLTAVATALAGAAFSQEKTAAPPVQVTIKDEQPVVEAETVLPVDPARRIQFDGQQLAVNVRTEKNETLHLSHFPSMLVDGQFLQQAQGRVEFQNKPLPKTKAGKQRDGFMTCHVINNDIKVTMTVTVVPTKPQGKAAKRRMDAVLIHYLIENNGNKAHTVGFRIYMDVFVIDNDGALFAAPTKPNMILDGVVLKGKDLPPYLQLLQHPNLKNPGFVAHLTMDLGSKLEKPDHLVLTRHGLGFGQWEMPAQNAGGDSALGLYWETKELKPGAKRELAYGYGQGIATSPESEGVVEMALGGSFEPGKIFTVTAYVSDPPAGQSLKLELPNGLELAEGRAVQSVPETREEGAPSVVLWRARVVRPGSYAVRVRSSTGIIQGKLLTITPVKG
jgi:predicted secreted protein